MAMDDTTASNLVNNTIRDYITPEIERRRQEGQLDDSFRWNAALVLFPKAGRAQVRFNGEFNLKARARHSVNGPIAAGQELTVFDIERVEEVRPITVDDTEVAFIFLQYTGTAWRIAFDFSPNHDDHRACSEDEQWAFSQLFCDVLNERQMQRMLAYLEGQDETLSRLGLWPVTALMPNPLGRCVRDVASTGDEAALDTLFTRCDSDFIHERAARWWSSDIYLARRQVLEEALHALSEGRYALAIYAFVPQLEGISSDWIAARSPDGHVPFRDTSKFKYVKGTAVSASAQCVEQGIAKQLIDHILDGPLMATFAKWSDPPTPNHLNRHMVAHGKFDPGIFTRENAIRAFLLVDTLCDVLGWYDQAGLRPAGNGT